MFDGALQAGQVQAGQESVKLLSKLLAEQFETNRLLRKLAGEEEPRYPVSATTMKDRAAYDRVLRGIERHEKFEAERTERKTASAERKAAKRAAKN